MENIKSLRGLTSHELLEIKELEKACLMYEDLNMKMNWDMLENRSVEEINDFLYYDGKKLVGFLGLYDIEKKSREIEIMGMVHPNYRRKGIFKKMFDLAKQECINRKAEKILLITESSSDAGKGFIKSNEGEYSFSEYRMKFEEQTVPYSSKYKITIHKVKPKDYIELVELDKLCFNLTEEDMDETSFRSNSEYVVELDNEIIGKIGIEMDGEHGYIFGFCIKPNYRRRGYGREVLGLALNKLLEENINTVLLEVAVKNEGALQLYKSLGFKEVTKYEYYEQGLSHNE